jgi:hypothetical protein
MGMGIGIGIGWPNSTSGANVVYSFYIYECGSSVPLIQVYSLVQYFNIGVYIYLDEALTMPVLSEYANEGPDPEGVYLITDGLITNTFISCG